MHARYVEQVLRDRGMPAPPLAQIETFVDSLSEVELPDVEERLRKLALGVEQREDAEDLLRRIASVGPAPIAAPPVEETRPAAAALKREARPPSDPQPTRATRRSVDALPPDVLSTLRQHGIHVYAKSAALKIELGTLRAADACGAVQYTVQLDAAKANAHGYDWHGKLPFQFTIRELPLLAAFLLGMSGDKLTCSNHGPNTDKHFEAQDQGANLFVKVRLSGGPTIALPVPPADVFAWGEMCLVALHLNRPTIGTDGHLALLRRVGRMEAARD